MSIFEYDQEKHIKLEWKQAWDEGREAGITEGKAAGKAEGEKLLLTKQIQKKLLRGKTPAQIADELEEDQSVIKELIKGIGNQNGF